MHHLGTRRLHRQVLGHNIPPHSFHSWLFFAPLSQAYSLTFLPLLLVAILRVGLCAFPRPFSVQILIFPALPPLLTPLATWPIPPTLPTLPLTPVVYHLSLLVFSPFQSLPVHVCGPLLLQAMPSTTSPAQPIRSSAGFLLLQRATFRAFSRVLVIVIATQELSVFI